MPGKEGGLSVHTIGTKVALVALAILLVAPTALAVSYGGKERELTVDGRAIHVQAPDGANMGQTGLAGGAGVAVSEAEVRLRDPSCKIQSGTEFSSSYCTNPEVAAKAPEATLAYDIDVNVAGQKLIGTGPSEAPAGSADVQSAAVLGAQTPLSVKVAATAATAAGMGLLVLGRLLRGLGLTFIPLYTHIQDDEILIEENRARIFQLIRSEPGVSTRDVAQRLGLAWGTVTHHLWKLEKRHLVISKKYGKYRRYFANGDAAGDRKDVMAVMRVARTAEVAKFIQAHPGITQKEVGEGMGVSSSTILWHVKRLEQVHLVDKVRDGKTVKYYPGEALVQPAGGSAPTLKPLSA